MLALVLLNACASASQLMDRQAQQLGLLRLEFTGTDYQHVIYRNTVHGDILHVYLAGDGTPWVGRYRVAADPTPPRSGHPIRGCRCESFDPTSRSRSPPL